jgi:HK97 family phage prohead protease
MTKQREHVFVATQLELRAATDAEPLPAGVCGRLTGVALVYDVVDAYGTMFARGCLDKTRTEKVPRNKVKLFADHGPFVECHVGVVRKVEDIGDAAVMTADLFDTEDGRKMKEYLAAVLAADAETGLSIGFRSRGREWRKPESGEGDSVLVFTEIELGEISITPVPAVPGTDVTGVRKEGAEDEDADDPALLKRALRHILAALPEREARAVVDAVYAPGAAKPDTPDAPQPTAGAGTADAEGAENAEGASLATSEERERALRLSFKP